MIFLALDPISLAGLALGGIAGGLMSGGGGGNTTTQMGPTPPAAPAPEAQTITPVQSPIGTKPLAKPQTSTFLGAAATPPPVQPTGQKSLLGQ